RPHRAGCTQAHPRRRRTRVGSAKGGVGVDRNGSRFRGRNAVLPLPTRGRDSPRSDSRARTPGQDARGPSRTGAFALSSPAVPTSGTWVVVPGSVVREEPDAGLPRGLRDPRYDSKMRGRARTPNEPGIRAPRSPTRARDSPTPTGCPVVPVTAPAKIVPVGPTERGAPNSPAEEDDGPKTLVRTRATELARPSVRSRGLHFPGSVRNLGQRGLRERMRLPRRARREARRPADPGTSRVPRRGVLAVGVASIAMSRGSRSSEVHAKAETHSRRTDVGGWKRRGVRNVNDGASRHSQVAGTPPRGGARPDPHVVP